MADVNSSLVYTRHTSPGVALIIVNEKYLKSGRRYGADKDFQGLTDTFRRLDFKIVALYDVTDKEILAVMRTGNAILKYCMNRKKSITPRTVQQG